MRFFIPLTLSLLGLLTLSSPAARAAVSLEIPPENKEPGTIAAIQSFDAKAQRLVDLLNQGQFDAAVDLFFPLEPFKVLKGIAKPEVYHQQLLQWYRSDLEDEHMKIGKSWTYVGFKLGSCKWKAKGTEANALPYWSCFNSKIMVKNADTAGVIPVRTLINWGREWYVTHLHPLPATPNKK